jgi:antitoxin (DNA-binding transcriptional repressor) of toxin-antitoxin stability system
LVNLVKAAPMPPFVSLYDAKTKLSSLVDRAAAGEEIVIAKNGVPPCDFDAPDPEIARLFACGSE